MESIKYKVNKFLNMQKALDMQKIKIAGAGIAGLSAAINLAKAGKKIEIFEVNKDCGTRFSGDLQGIENWSYDEDALAHLERMGIKIDFPYTPVTTVKVTNKKVSLITSTKSPMVYLVKRGPYHDTLDYALKMQALKLGVKIYFNRACNEKDAHVIATGHIGKNPFAIDEGIVFNTDMENIAEIVFNDDLGYKGYSYLLVINGYGCMCTVVAENFEMVGECFNKTRNFFTKKYRLRVTNEKRAGGVGSFSTNNTFFKDNRLYVGEAAGIQDALLGFGIRSSLYSGYLAARMINDNLNPSDEYQKIAKKEFSPRLKASFVNRFIWNRLGKNYGLIMYAIKRSNDPKKMLKKIYNYGLMHKILFPLVYYTRYFNGTQRYI